MNLVKEEEEEEMDSIMMHLPPKTRQALCQEFPSPPSPKLKTRRLPPPPVQKQDSIVSVSTRRFQWKSCCFKIDKRVLVFSSQLIISIIILIFSMVQLIGEHGNCEGSAPYLTLISTLIGYWLPSPTIK